MEKRSRTEITIETDRVFVISKRRRQAQGWCFDCLPPSKMLTPEEVVEATGITSRAAYRAVETGKVHFAETPEGSVLICLNSLSFLGSQTVGADLEASLRIAPSPGSEIRCNAEQRLKGPPKADLEILDAAAPTGVSCKENDTQRPTHRKKVWVLTPEVFDKLLDCLDRDREQAGQKYETIHRKLIKYFEYRGCLSPEDQADETMNRVARSIGEGREIWTTDPISYFFGVARYILKEYWHSPDRDISPLECVSSMAHPAERQASLNATSLEPSLEPELQALDHCIGALSAEDRQLILQYYQGEKSDKIRNRQSIATRLGIPLNALRIKVHRLRKRLEADVSEYLRRHE